MNQSQRKSLGMKKIRLLKLKTTDSVGATVHSSSISSDDFIDFDKDIVEKMGMKKIIAFRRSYKRDTSTPL